MRAIVMTEFGGPEVLHLSEVDQPEPGPGEVRVRLTAAGVNPAETYIRTGGYAFFVPDLPHTPGFDGAGEVDALGAEVTGLDVGQRVFVSSILGRHRTGTYAEYVVCDADCVHALPDRLSAGQGAAVGVPCSTAWRALFQRGGMRPGDTVLVHGASGGVGLPSVQLARAHGATVIGTSGTEAGRALVADAGADHVLDHTDPDHLAALPDLTGGHGADLVVEMLADRNLVADLGCLAVGGTIVVVGSRGALEFEPRLTMGKDADIRGLALWNTSESHWCEIGAALTGQLAAGVLTPYVGTVIALAEAARAHREIIDTPALGKMVLEI